MRTFFIGLLSAITIAGSLFAVYAWAHWRGDRAAAPAAAARKILYWVDPMHPSYRSPEPGIAPDCGMKLVPVYAEERKTDGAGRDVETASGGTVHVSPDMQQMAGVQYSVVAYSTETATIRAPGRVVPDETRLTRVYPHMEGWISKTFVDFTGQMVKKGDLMLSIYSPEVVAGEQELVLALRIREQMKASPVKEAWGNSELLVQAARKRLQVFDLTPAQIAAVEQTRLPVEGATMRELFDKAGTQAADDSHATGTVQTIAVYSPATGYVTARNAYAAQHVTPDTELYDLSDLSHMWIMADIFESDIASIHEGQNAVVSGAYGEAPSFTARVTYIQPQVDPQTRTAKVRLEVSNEHLQLKLDMFVNVQFPVGAARKLMVPADAVMDFGLKQTAYVDRGNGYLECRAVRIGQRRGDRVEILDGLKPGERIVTSGTFLIDSESRLRAGTAMSVPAAGQGHD
jgi:Cu(I)/Ag(I) efflux system membrane fusion protein